MKDVNELRLWFFWKIEIEREKQIKTKKKRVCKCVSLKVKDSKSKRSVKDNLTIYHSKVFFLFIVLNMYYHKIHAELHEQSIKLFRLYARTTSESISQRHAIAKSKFWPKQPYEAEFGVSALWLERCMSPRGMPWGLQTNVQLLC